MITPTWNHLWYLVYVLAYILLVLPFLPWLKRFAASRVWSALTSSRVAVAVLLILPFVAFETWLVPRFPTTHALVGDWANHAHRFSIFLIGFLVAKDAGFWHTVRSLTFVAAGLAVGAWFFLANGSDIAAWARQYVSGTPLRFAFSYVMVIYAWSCMLILFGIGQRFLNRESPTCDPRPLCHMVATARAAACAHVARARFSFGGRAAGGLLSCHVGLCCRMGMTPFQEQATTAAGGPDEWVSTQDALSAFLLQAIGRLWVSRPPHATFEPVSVLHPKRKS